MKKLSEKLKDYAWESGQDPDFWVELIGNITADKLLFEIKTALNNCSGDQLYRVLQFIRDIMNPVPDIVCREDFLAQFYKSEVIEKLEMLSTDDNYFKRSSSIQTLGQIFSRDSFHKLLTIFNESKEKDPLFIRDLAQEIFWLHPDDRDLKNSIKTKMAYSAESFTRWAVLDIIGLQGSSSQSKDRDVDIHICSILENDTFEYIKNEAGYIKAAMEYRDMVQQNKNQKKELKRGLEQKKPKYTFQDFKLSFEKKMIEEELKNYATGDLWVFLKDYY